MSNLVLRSFPSISDANNARTICNDFNYTSYPFFDENGDANPNLIGVNALLQEDGNSNGMVSFYSYLCPYNIVADYASIDFFGRRKFILCKCVVSYNEQYDTLEHQIFNNEGIIVSGKLLYETLSNDNGIEKIYNVEYINNNFKPIVKINKSTTFEDENGVNFRGTTIMTVRLPYNSSSSGLIIGESAFEGCEYLTDFYCYHGIKEVGENAFARCTSLSGNEISCNDSIGLYIDENSDDKKIVVAKSNLPKCLKICFDCKNGSFSDCTNLKNIMFYDKENSSTYEMNVNRIYLTSSYNKYNPQEINVNHDDNNRTPYPIYFGKNGSYNNGAFYEIGEGAFSGCTSLSGIGHYYVYTEETFNHWTTCTYRRTYTDDIFVPKSVDLSSAKYAFAGCTNLSGPIYFEFKDENVVIAEGAFSGCTNITSLNLKGSNKIKAENIGNNAFKGCCVGHQNITELEKIASNVSSTDVTRIFG